MKICITALMMLMSFSLWVNDGKSPSEEGDEGFLSGIIDLVEENRPWAKPIHRVDMDRMRELKEMGLLTFHQASWFVEVDPDER